MLCHAFGSMVEVLRFYARGDENNGTRARTRDAWLHIESCYPLLLFANNGCVSKTYQLFLTRIALQNQKLRVVLTVPKRSTGHY